MKRSAHFKPVLDDSWITVYVDTTSFQQHKLYHCPSYLSHPESE